MDTAEDASAKEESSHNDDERAATMDAAEAAGGVAVAEKEQPITTSTGSKLHRHSDPFAQRKGKTLVWTRVNMTLVSTVRVRVFPPSSCLFSFPIDVHSSLTVVLIDL